MSTKLIINKINTNEKKITFLFQINSLTRLQILNSICTYVCERD